MKLPTTLLLLAAFSLGCAHGAGERGPALSELRREASLPDGRWLIEGQGSVGQLRVEAGAARLEFPGPEGRLPLSSWRAGELWGLRGELQGQPIALRALLADDGAGWIWQLGGTFRGTLRPVLPAERLEGAWEIAPLAGGALPESLELRAGELWMTSGVRERYPCLLVDRGAGERALVPADPDRAFVPFHLLSLAEGWIVWQEGQPMSLGFLHRPGERPAWIDEVANARQGAGETRRFALSSYGMVGELKLEAAAAHMSWEGLLGEKKLDLQVAGVAGPVLRLEDRQEPRTSARLLTSDGRGFFWIEGEELVLPAFEVVAPAPTVLGRWKAAPARLGAGGLGLEELELGAERVAMIQERGESFEYPALACGLPDAPIFFLRGPGAGLTVALNPVGAVVAVSPPSDETALTVLFRGRAPGWLPLYGLDAAADAFCRAAKEVPASKKYGERLQELLGRLDAQRSANDALTDLLMRLESLPREARYPLLVRELDTLGVRKWKCKAAEKWLAAPDE